MQKKVIALAIAAATSGVAFAQTNVTVYGNVDMGFMNRGGQNGGSPAVNKSTNSLGSYGSESYIGFKGSEDLGNGLKAIFDVAYLIAPDQNQGLGNNGGTGRAARQYLGLTGGFGTVVAGYLDGVRYGIVGKHDPFGNYSVGNFQQMSTHYARAQNAVAYISPNVSGFTFIYAHATNTIGAENAGNQGDDRLNTVAVNYTNGPLVLDADYETTRKVGNGNDNRLYVATLAGSYDFGVAKVGIVLDKIYGEANSTIGSDDRRNLLVGVTVPVSAKASVLASYGRVNDKVNTNADASKWSVGARYSLSKRTQLYTNFTKITNDDNADYTVTPSGNAGALAGLGTRGFDLGIKHSF